MLLGTVAAISAPILFAALFLIFRAGRKTGLVAGALVGGAIVAGIVVGGRPVGEPLAETSSVSFAVPAQEAYEEDLFHARRGLVGCNTARMWVAFDVGSTTYAVSGDCNGSRANPSTFVPALSGATHAYANLGTVDQTSAQVADDFVTAITGLGLTAATDGVDAEGRTIVTVTGADNLQLPAAVARNNALRGMWGMQRDEWGTGAEAQPNLNGGTDGTGSIHLGPLSNDANIGAGLDARILGAYIWGTGGYTPLLAAGTGPTYALDPGAITIGGEAQITNALGTNEFGFVLFDDPISISTSDQLWAFYRGSTATAPGGPRYRSHALTPVGNGDIPVGQQLTWDTTAAFATTDSFGSSYDPTADANFTIYIVIGLLIEVEDGSGNYPADGTIDILIGDQNDDDEHGTQFAAGPALIDLETTHHLLIYPDLTTVEATEVTRAVDAIGSDEDSRVAIYGPWASLTIPTPGGSEADLLSDMGLMGLAGNSNQYNTLTLGTPVDVSACANDYCSLGFSYVRDGGAANNVYTLPVFLGSGSDHAFTNAWVDARSLWHDDIRGASGQRLDLTWRTPLMNGSGSSEYRTTAGNANFAGVVTDDYTDVWIDPFGPDPSDDSPNAIALDRIRLQAANGIAIGIAI